jgi:hypothetical protein|nr:MAG TPA: hypothetical protein [Caudoviricetes sp.]
MEWWKIYQEIKEAVSFITDLITIITVTSAFIRWIKKKMK